MTERSDAGRTAAVQLTISGAVRRILHDGSYRDDYKRGWSAVETGQRRKMGVGEQTIATMSREDATDLWWYLRSYAEALESMTPNERGPDGTREARAIRKAMDGIVKVTGDLDPQGQEPQR